MKRYVEVVEETKAIVNDHDPDIALAKLRIILAKEKELLSVCHGLVHEVGHAAYAKYGFEEAIAFEDDLCGSGYIHGIVETHMEGIDDIPAALPTLCPPTAAKCFHGIGHGLMYTSVNNLEESIRLCGTFKEGFQRIQCAEGVFMENFDAEGRFHRNPLLNPEDPYSVCRVQSTINEGVCAFYAPRYYVRIHPREYQAAFAWCNSEVPVGPRDACIKGVGDVAAKQNIDDPLSVEKLCMTLEGERRRFCIEGLTSYTIVHYASALKGRALCRQMQKENREWCLKIYQESRRLYPE